MRLRVRACSAAAEALCLCVGNCRIEVCDPRAAGEPAERVVRDDRLLEERDDEDGAEHARVDACDPRLLGESEAGHEARLDVLPARGIGRRDEREEEGRGRGRVVRGAVRVGVVEALDRVLERVECVCEEGVLCDCVQ